jgi:release factor glutamine methyltransferase
MTLASLLESLRPGLLPSSGLNFLLAGLLDCSVPALKLQHNRKLAPPQQVSIRDALLRLEKGEPPQYILGKTWFYCLELKVDPRVLIPRPETEGLVKLALERLKPEARVLEIGTGSGAIAIALKQTGPNLSVMATDISSAALELARDNASRHICAIDFVEADLFPPGDFRFDLGVSNPPYISEKEYSELEPMVRDYEPRQALLAAEEGLEYYRYLFSGLPNQLNDGGLALFEHGALQRQSIIALGAEAGFECCLAKDDLAGRNRYLGFRLKRNTEK